MTVATVNSEQIPSTFKGHVKFHPQPVKYSGDGTPFANGEQWYEWDAAGCKASDWDWWMTRYNSGSVLPFVLPTDDSVRSFYTFSGGRLRRPTFERCEGGVYLGVHIEIHLLVPLQANP